MKIKYKQKKPALLEKMLKETKISNYIKNLPSPIESDIKQCPNCNKFYDAKKAKPVCINCFALLPK